MKKQHWILLCKNKKLWYNTRSPFFFFCSSTMELHCLAALLQTFRSSTIHHIAHAKRNMILAYVHHPPSPTRHHIPYHHRRQQQFASNDSNLYRYITIYACNATCGQNVRCRSYSIASSSSSLSLEFLYIYVYVALESSFLSLWFGIVRICLKILRTSCFKLGVKFYSGAMSCG